MNLHLSVHCKTQIARTDTANYTYEQLARTQTYSFCEQLSHNFAAHSEAFQVNEDIRDTDDDDDSEQLQQGQLQLAADDDGTSQQSDNC